MQKQGLIIVDFGSQYTQLIARRIREIGCYSHIVPPGGGFDSLPFEPMGVVLSGGPKSVFADDALPIPEEVFALKKPILGVCYGMQALAKHFGGVIEEAKVQEYGMASLHIKKASPLTQGMPDSFSVWMSHSDKVSDLPASFDWLAKSDNAVAMVCHKELPIYGVQFHPEVSHTEHSSLFIENFALGVCGCRKDWEIGLVKDTIIKEIRDKAGDSIVLLAMSGGVDSSVLATLVHEAIGERLICVFIDNGLLRHREAEWVKKHFGNAFGKAFHYVDASDRFLSALKGVSDPEEKRRKVGEVFIRSFEDFANALPEKPHFLAQGTIYPDIIESSGSHHASLIKSHHNVGGLPERMDFLLLEPLRFLFKDEVRALGRDLGMERYLIERHPFPGPGLSVRVLGEVKREYLAVLRQADYIFTEALRKEGYYEQSSQAFAVFLPVRSVGVVGDSRRYAYVIALRSVSTSDFMTAKFSRLPLDFLDKVATDIVNTIPEVSRVVFDISSKPPSTIEWE